MGEINADAGTSGAWFYHERERKSGGSKGMIRSRFFHPGSLWSRNLVCLEDHLRNFFIHGKGAAKGTWAGITDAEDIKGCLEFSVFSYVSVKSHKYDVCKPAKFDDIGAEKAV